MKDAEATALRGRFYILTRIFLVAVALMWLCILIIGYYGRDLIEAIYYGRASLLNSLISGQQNNSLAAYLELFSDAYRFLILVGLLATLSVPIIVRILRLEISSRPPTRRDAVLFAFLLVILIITIYSGWLGYVNDNTWRIGDWLINYQGGFVRRGITGEIFFILWNATGIPPSIFVILFQSICYSAFFLFTGLLLRRQDDLVPYIVLIASPFIFMYQIHDIQGGFRKEIEYFALFSFYAWSQVATSRTTFRHISIAVFLAYPVLILSHEILAVFLPYLIAIFLIGGTQEPRKMVLVAALTSISIVSFVLALLFPGDSSTSAAICESLGRYSPPQCTDQGAIAALAEDIHYGMAIVSSNISSNSYIGKYSSCILLATIAFLPIVDRFKACLSQPIVGVLMLSSILGTIPLLFVAVDWGRFIYIHLVSLFVISLLFSSACARRQGRRPFSIVPTIATQEQSKLGYWAVRILFVTFLLAYSTLWHIPHSGNRSPFLFNFS